VRASEAGTMIQLREAVEGLMIPATTNHIIKRAMLDQRRGGDLLPAPTGKTSNASLKTSHYLAKGPYYRSSIWTIPIDSP